MTENDIRNWQGLPPDLQRHVVACSSAVLPGGRRRFCLGDTPVGWLRPDFARALARQPEITEAGDAVRLSDAASLPDLARRMSELGHYRFRREAFDVRGEAQDGPALDSPALATIDRGALPSFGIVAHGAHLNGLVRRDDGLHLWVGRRAADKLLDPNKLDNVTAGGMAAGSTPERTLVKEAGEEAGISPELAARAVPVARFSYAMERPEGLRRDVLHCFDLELPESFVPRPVDGEISGFELWPMARVLATVRETDEFKFNVSLVLIDLFRRLRLVG